eukprot:gene18672-28825_t
MAEEEGSLWDTDTDSLMSEAHDPPVIMVTEEEGLQSFILLKDNGWVASAYGSSTPVISSLAEPGTSREDEGPPALKLPEERAHTPPHPYHIEPIVRDPSIVIDRLTVPSESFTVWDYEPAPSRHSKGTHSYSTHRSTHQSAPPPQHHGGDDVNSDDVFNSAEPTADNYLMLDYDDSDSLSWDSSLRSRDEPSRVNDLHQQFHQQQQHLPQCQQSVEVPESARQRGSSGALARERSGGSAGGGVLASPRTLVSPPSARRRIGTRRAPAASPPSARRTASHGSASAGTPIRRGASGGGVAAAATPPPLLGSLSARARLSSQGIGREVSSPRFSPRVSVDFAREDSAASARLVRPAPGAALHCMRRKPFVSGRPESPGTPVRRLPTAPHPGSPRATSNAANPNPNPNPHTSPAAQPNTGRKAGIVQPTPSRSAAPRVSSPRRPDGAAASRADSQSNPATNTNSNSFSNSSSSGGFVGGQAAKPRAAAGGAGGSPAGLRSNSYLRSASQRGAFVAKKQLLLNCFSPPSGRAAAPGTPKESETALRSVGLNRAMQSSRHVSKRL